MLSQLAAIPCLAFLVQASLQDVRYHAVSRLTLLSWTVVGLAGSLAGAWSWSFLGAGLGFLLVTVAGAPSGDRFGAMVVGGYLGPSVGFAVALAVVLAFLRWRCWGTERSPADFAFFPFLLAGAIGVILSATIYATL